MSLLTTAGTSRAVGAFIDLLLFAVGLFLLVVGAEGLVRGASAIAARMGVRPITIGLTVVALGTSAPELVVALVAAARGQTDIVLGAVVGSNILNILVVLGATALLAPFFLQRETLRQDLPLVSLVSVATFMLASDGSISRLDGGLLLAALVAYTVHLNRRGKAVAVGVAMDPPDPDAAPAWVPVVMGLAGGTLLVFGADFVVEGGTGIARGIGLPERVIALTLVALGTSAPELATALVAAYRRHVDLAIGNVVGSNLLNILFVLGSAALIRDIPVSQAVLRSDLLIMVLTTFLLMMLLLTSSRRRVGRAAGAVLVLAYVAYVVSLLTGIGSLT